MLSGARLPRTISAWQALNFMRAGVEDVQTELHLTSTRRIPKITRPDHLLIKVEAASLNPVDLLLLKGYGSSSFNLLRRLSSDLGLFGLPDLQGSVAADYSGLPFTPGRDFAGIIVDVGPKLSYDFMQENNLTVGCRVAGATWPFLSSVGSGSLTEFIVCPASYIAQIPSNVSSVHASALGYAGLTAWSALVDVGGLKPKKVFIENTTNFPSQPLVLVAGATGGVGIITAQLAQLWGARVHVTCPGDTKALNLMKKFNFEEVIVHPDEPPASIQYDIIIDCIRPKCLDQLTGTNQPSNFNSILPTLPRFYSSLSSYSCARYVCLSPPLLYLTDWLGPFLGTSTAVSHLALVKLMTWCNPISPKFANFRWAFFRPSGSNLQYLLHLVEKNQLFIPIDTIFRFDQVPEAFDKLVNRGVRGKIVIDMNLKPHSEQ